MVVALALVLALTDDAESATTTRAGRMLAHVAVLVHVELAKR